MLEPRRRNVALVLAGLMLLLSAPADAKKKKKGAKKHKTPSGKTVDKAAPAESDEEEETGSKDAKESGGAASESTPTPTPEAAAGEEKPAESAPRKRAAATEASEPSEIVPPAMRLVLGGGGLFRRLDWNEDLSGMLAPYSLSPGPMVRFSAEVYPAAFSTTGIFANIGLFADIGYGFGVKSQTQSGAQLTTKFYDFAAGLKIRIPLGTFEPYFSGAFGGQAFRLDGQGPTTGPPVPGVNYQFIRGGLGTRIYFTPMIDLNVGGGFDIVITPGTGTGDIKSDAFFPGSQAYAIDAGASLGFRVSSAIGLRAGGDFRQYGYTLHWMSGQPYMVGGAIDRYITVWGGLEVVFDGVPEEAPAPAARSKRAPAAEPESTGE